MLGLTKYDAACKALAEARSVDEVKKIRDVSEAMRVYAKQAKNRKLEVHAAEIRIRAERRVGELMKAQRETTGLAKGQLRRGGALPPRENKTTLAEAGIDKDLAKRARKLAAVPVDEFEAEVAGWRERVSRENERVTTRLEHRGARELAEDEEEEAGAESSFLLRAEAAVELAFYSDGPVTKDVVRHAKRAADAWTKLAEQLEKEYSK